MAMATAAQQRSRRRTPPNLRKAPPNFDGDKDGVPDRCGTCTFFTAGKCRLYGGYPVSAGQVCNSYRASRKGG
jgi:hypothetical protein